VMVTAHVLIIVAVLHLNQKQNHKRRLVMTAPASLEIGRAGAGCFFYNTFAMIL